MQIRPQPLQATQRRHKVGHPLRKDGLPCTCMVALAVVEAQFACPALSLIQYEYLPGTL